MVKASRKAERRAQSKRTRQLDKLSLSLLLELAYEPPPALVQRAVAAFRHHQVASTPHEVDKNPSTAA